MEIWLKKLNNERREKLNKLDKNLSNYEQSAKEINDLYDSEILKAKTNAYEIVNTQKEKIKQIKFDNKHTPRRLLNEIQMIFQDPIDSLDPRMTVEDIIQEGLIIQGHKNKAENHKKIVEMLNKVGLVSEHA